MAKNVFESKLGNGGKGEKKEENKYRMICEGWKQRYEDIRQLHEKIGVCCKRGPRFLGDVTVKE